jgi:hypothetical protein
MPDFDVPDIPWELVDEAKRKSSKVWNLQDLALQDPALTIGWQRPESDTQSHSSMGGLFKSPVSQMIRDPEVDLRAQLTLIREEIEHLEAGVNIGTAVVNVPALHLMHFGTGPVASAFGARWIIRDDEMPFFEPAVHTPEEAMRLEKPHLLRDGIMPRMLERIDYFNEGTKGKIPIEIGSTDGPWSVATQVWHYEDILQAIHTAPEAVHHLLDLVTDAIIEWSHIQVTRMGRWSGKYGSPPYPWHPRGLFTGEDPAVAVSPATWEEFFLPYNSRLSSEFGGLIYHCCMRWDWIIPLVPRTEGFMGMDAHPEFNDFETIVAALAGRGAYLTRLGDVPKSPPLEGRREGDVDLIRRLKGKAGLFLGVHGDDREDAVDRAKRLLDAI